MSDYNLDPNLTTEQAREAAVFMIQDARYLARTSRQDRRRGAHAFAAQVRANAAHSLLRARAYALVARHGSAGEALCHVNTEHPAFQTLLLTHRAALTPAKWEG